MSGTDAAREERLDECTACLNEQRYEAIRYTGPETHVLVGLDDSHFGINLASPPLVHSGRVTEGTTLRMRYGSVGEATATSGQDELDGMGTADDAVRFGDVQQHLVMAVHTGSPSRPWDWRVHSDFSM